MYIYSTHIYIYMFVYYLESGFAKSDVIFIACKHPFSLPAQGAAPAVETGTSGASDG